MARKQNSKWSCLDCVRIIKENRDNTNWFNYELTFDEMWEMLRYQMAFGEAETAVIMASLVRNGAKFR